MRAQIRILIWIQPMRYAKSCQKVFKMLINDFVKYILHCNSDLISRIDEIKISIMFAILRSRIRMQIWIVLSRLQKHCVNNSHLIYPYLCGILIDYKQFCSFYSFLCGSVNLMTPFRILLFSKKDLQCSSTNFGQRHFNNMFYILCGLYHKYRKFYCPANLHHSTSQFTGWKISF